MIGTGYEMLYYLTYDHNSRERMGIPHNGKKLGNVRHHCVVKIHSEATVARMLTAAGCRIVRNAFVMPAVLQNKKGNKMYDERTVLYAIKQEDFPEFDLEAIKEKVKQKNTLPDPLLIKKIVRRKNFKIITERITLDSVWEYSPIYDSVVSRAGLGRIIGDGF